MPLLNFDAVPNNLVDSINGLINQPDMLPRFSNLTLEEDVNVSSILAGGKKPSKSKPKSKPTPKPKSKQIDTFLKTDLEKIAKKHDVSLKTRDGKIKTKEQLFKSLKQKKLV